MKQMKDSSTDTAWHSTISILLSQRKQHQNQLHAVRPSMLSIDRTARIHDQITHRYSEVKTFGFLTGKGKLINSWKINCLTLHLKAPPPHLSGSAHLVIGGGGRLVLIGCRQGEVERVDSRLPQLGLLWDLDQDGGSHLHLDTYMTHAHSMRHTKRARSDFLLLSGPHLLHWLQRCTGKVSWRPWLHPHPWNRLQHLSTPSEWGCSVAPEDTHAHKHREKWGTKLSEQ